MSKFTQQSILLSVLIYCISAMLLLGREAEVKMPAQPPACPVPYIMDGLLASDGTVWIVGEHEGIYKLGPENSYGGPWFHANYYEGYPQSNCFYAIAEDKQGRIWVGTDNQGVAVFNGVSWKTYNRENALIGERIFDIAVSPQTGEVAIATSGGVTIYHPGKNTWHDYTRADGLVEDQVECLAFTKEGHLWIGYACGGVSVASPVNRYATWKTVQAPWYWDRKQYQRQPKEPRGSGLPSNLCNALMVGSNGTLWLGTNNGLAWKSGASDWKYMRGEDFKDKNREIYGPKPANRLTATRNLLVPEDFVTCLAETSDGLWVGTRRSGAALINLRSMNTIKRYRVKEKHHKWATIFPNRLTSLIAFPDGSVWGTTYGAGVVQVNKGTGQWKTNTQRSEEDVPHPVLPPQPSDNQLFAAAERLTRLNNTIRKSPVLFWKDDWSTQGNWCGRYGSNYALLCSMNAPWADEIYRHRDGYMVDGAIGPKRTKDDFLRHWVEEISAPHDNNALYCPTDATRCKAVWDDHGEAYSMTYDGPDVWVIVKVPEGRHIVALYFFNPNGHVQNAAYRDYILEVRKPRLDIPEFLLFLRDNTPKAGQIANPFSGLREKAMGEALSAPVLARTRVKDMAGSGVYKNFLVEGQGVYLFRVCRNYAYNTEISGIFIERVDQNSPANERANKGHFNFAGIYPKKPLTPEGLTSVERNLLELRQTCPFNSGPALSAYQKASIYLYRQARSEGKNELSWLLQWNLNEWSQGDRDHFNQTMKQSWAVKQEKIPEFRSRQFMPHAPDTIPFTVDEVLAMERLGINWKQYRPGYGGRKTHTEEELRPLLAADIERNKQELALILEKQKHMLTKTKKR